jgi:dTDP-4-dehydrorhamnose 3,5-epimerase
MNFIETGIPGAVIVEPSPRGDARGFFARVWCEKEFGALGLSTRFVQANMSVSTHRATLRGLHYQAAPHSEAKLIRCTRGCIYDVVVDLRPRSPGYGRWIGRELSADNRRMLYVPEGCAHGYQTLADDTEVFYPVTAPYAPDSERGIRFDDPAFGIEWPLEVAVMSEKDRSWPDYEAPLGSTPADGLQDVPPEPRSR